MDFATKKMLPSLFLYERNPLTNKLPKSIIHFMKILDEYNFLIEIKEDFYLAYEKYLSSSPHNVVGLKMNFLTASKQFHLKNNKFVKQFFEKNVTRYTYV